MKGLFVWFFYFCFLSFRNVIGIILYFTVSVYLMAREWLGKAHFISKLGTSLKRYVGVGAYPGILQL